jgi:hypothetical protein
MTLVVTVAAQGVGDEKTSYVGGTPKDFPVGGFTEGREVGDCVSRYHRAVVWARTGHAMQFADFAACQAYKAADQCGSGTPHELRGLRKVFVDAGDAGDYRALIVAESREGASRRRIAASAGRRTNCAALPRRGVPSAGLPPDAAWWARRSERDSGWPTSNGRRVLRNTDESVRGQARDETRCRVHRGLSRRESLTACRYRARVPLAQAAAWTDYVTDKCRPRARSN